MPTILEDTMGARMGSMSEEVNESVPLTDNTNGENGVSNGKLARKEMVDDAENLQAKKLKYPWYIVFILGNEFCERFSYYGMKAVLTLYFVEVLLWSDSTTVLAYHLFSVLCYFTPVFGAMLADGFLGKFNTIFYLSIVYVGGLVLLTLAAIPPLNLHVLAGTACGLLLIAFGTGGIKPVVPAYGGDQFQPGQEKQRARFFSVFYFSINAGSLISTFVTPILRSEVPCFGSEGCYPLAFGLPAGLLACSVVAFLIGRPFYRNLPSKENVIAKVFGCTFSALHNKIRGRGPAGASHWLDNTSSAYSAAFVKDVKQILPVLAMFLPLPMFWALFDQQGSRWTLQATRMDGRVTDTYTWKPDQVQIFNPVMILLMIPMFEGAVFPLMDKLKIPFKELARMTAGMVLAGLAFVIAGVVQMQLDNTLPVALAAHTAEVRFYNTLPCHFNLTLQEVDDLTAYTSNTDGKTLFSVSPYGEHVLPAGFSVPNNNRTVRWTTVATDCPSLKDGTYTNTATITKLNVTSVVLVRALDSTLTSRVLVLAKKEKPKEGRTQARFILPFNFNTSSGGGEVTLINRDVKVGKKGHVYNLLFDRLDEYSSGSGMVNVTADLDQGKYEMYYPDEHTETGKRRVSLGILDLPNGGVYTVILKTPSNDSDEQPWIRYDIVPPSSLSVFWQLPQYFVLTLGEVLFSVSGLSFAYSQAPVSMKSVLQAGWLLTVAFGNVLVIIISSARLTDNQATEFFIFAGLIGAFAVFFGIMVKFYKYVDNTVATVGENTKVVDDDTDSL